MNLLDASDVTHHYRSHRALSNVSLTLNPGELVVLIGPNGSGKSTLIKALLGNLDSTGTINWNGIPVRNWRKRDLARVVAYLPQAPIHDPGQTVLDVLRLGRAPYWGAFGLESSGDGPLILEVARLLGLENLLHRPVDEMSGGQRQRVFIGRCLSQQPAALLLDEPNTFLDLRHQVDLCKMLRDFATRKKIAVLMASHELNVAGAYADRLVLLNQGAVAATGSADQVLRPEVLSPVYGLEMQRFGDARNPVVAVSMPQAV